MTSSTLRTAPWVHHGIVDFCAAPFLDTGRVPCCQAWFLGGLRHSDALGDPRRIFGNCEDDIYDSEAGERIMIHRRRRTFMRVG